MVASRDQRPALLLVQAAAVTGMPPAALASIGWECAMKFACAGSTSAAKSAGNAAGSRYKKSSFVARMSALAAGACESRPTALSPWSGMKAAMSTRPTTFGALPAFGVYRPAIAVADQKGGALLQGQHPLGRRDVVGK